ncbi:PREDICTED: alpha-hemoglobin-stabilizing protein [Chinchilla lanigera]|uniref:alpha-hemoglobin-stabilizing protein n=1 Tax=Chinchilla lanigera TaxID=34839 RepID=UPI00038F0495|nr:PREDICTED: alpha-hemoglobin-stabilizing protein [Chinchilla lanigera]XP_005405381.1 PREDICTED: alpha-hemoglobin-stabilizing protein [Chinchilla lanigera]
MALLQANKDLISTGMKEFNVLLNQQVFDNPLITEEDMVVIVDDWMNIYLNFYGQRMAGEKEEQDKALQEFQRELKALANPFLDKYRAFLKSHEDVNHAPPSS